MILQGINGKYECSDTAFQHNVDENQWFVSTKGRDCNSGEPVVVRKLLLPNCVSGTKHFDIIYTFLTQSHTIHDNIVRTIDICVHDNELYIIREYVWGVSLQHILFTPDFSKHRTPLFMRDVIIQLLQILKKLHEYSVVHRSICAQHVYITTNQAGEINEQLFSVKLVGLEYAQVGGQSLFSFPRTPIVPKYSAPELVLNFPSLITTVSDIYSVGILLYESLSLKHAFEVAQKDLLLHSQVSFPLTKRWNIPQEMFEVISKACYKHSFSMPPSRYSRNDLEYVLKVACSQRYFYAADMIEAIDFAMQQVIHRSKKSIMQRLKLTR